MINGRIILILILSLVVTGWMTGPAASRDTAAGTGVEGHLEKAEKWYRKAVDLDRSDPDSARYYYMKSIMHYRWIVEEGGIDNGKLYYNIGNAYFRLGDVGRAILNYRRASLYIPGDQNLKTNLDYARSRKVDRAESRESTKIFRTLFFLHYDIPFQLRGMISTVSFALIWILAAVHLFLKRSWIKISLIVVVVVCVLFLASVTVEMIDRSQNPAGVIVAGEIVARKGDARTYQPSFTEPLHSGTEFTLVERRGDWWHIQLVNGEKCWIPSEGGELVME